MSTATIARKDTESKNLKKGKDDPRTRVRARAFSRWFSRYRKDVMVMSQAEFGNYMQQFIIYLLKLEGTNLTARDRHSAEERLHGELTEMARGFEMEGRYSESRINESWTKLFLLFCITGNIHSSYNVFDYLDSNDDSYLPKEAWTRKEVLLAVSAKPPSEDRQMEAKNVQPQKTARRQTMELFETSIADLLSEYVRKEMTDRGIGQDSVLRSLVDEMNEEGEDFVRMELEFILNRVNNYSYFGRVRAIVRRFAEMELFIKPDDSAYSVSELFALPLGFELIKEENQKPLRSQ